MNLNIATCQVEGKHDPRGLDLEASEATAGAHSNVRPVIIAAEYAMCRCAVMVCGSW
jgi:hypothetical protein